MVFKYAYPTLLQSANLINSNSWFDIKIRKNNKYKQKNNKIKLNNSLLSTIKIKLFLNDNQKKLINQWMNDIIDVYNLTNEFIKQEFKKNKDYKIINFFSLRMTLKDKINKICKKNNLNKHTADYSVKHCVEMYKSALSNHKTFNKFDIKNLLKNRRRKNLIIEPNSISKKHHSIFYRNLRNINSSIPLDIISKNSILQYDSYKKTYIIISPYEYNKKEELKREEKCGIDIGCRTFLTTYSPKESLEIGCNAIDQIDKYNKKLDSIKKTKSYYKNLNRRLRIKFKKLENKYSDKLSNKINDMHNKACNYLLRHYETIIIGKVSTKSMVSNLKGNIEKITKRRLLGLKHYRFRMKLLSMSKKYDCKIKLINEYMTSKTCSECGSINKNLGSNKIYKCINKSCLLKIDRDINAAINIYNK